MTIKIRLAVRDWDYFTPLALGDIKSDKFALELHRVDALPHDLASDPHYDAAEISLSRYTQACDNGQPNVLGVPHFLMRGFRHRCIIVNKSSRLAEISDLAGKRIGLTGWQDSGNVWTRALLEREGVDIRDIKWTIGRLTHQDPFIDKSTYVNSPRYIESIPNHIPLLELLGNGKLDAVFTAFMPRGFFDEDSPFRQLLPYCRQAEYEYFKQVGYVPGIHLLGLKTEVAALHPWLINELTQLIDSSVQLWHEKRIKYADTTPWLLDEIRQVSRDLPTTWNKNGYKANETMVADFCYEMYTQELTDNLLSPADLFPDFANR